MTDTRAGTLLALTMGPILLALALGLLSLPLVAFSLDAVDPHLFVDEPSRIPVTDPGRWEGAVGAVLASALIAGTIGPAVIRRHAIRGGLFTLLVAWAVAIAALPVLPALLHHDIGFVKMCVDACSAAIDARDPASGLRALPLSWLGPLFAPVPFEVLALGVATWTPIVRLFSRGASSAPGH